VPVCAACGESNPERGRYCLACGSDLKHAADESRKIVTIMFADVVGSTSIGEQVDPESLRRLLASYFERIEAIVGRYGGTVEKYIGDAVMAAFGLPVAHEDDALRAVRAAADVRAEVASLSAARSAAGRTALRWRIGVNTGEVVVGGEGAPAMVVSDAVNVAARLEQAAAPGQILLGEATYAYVRDAVTVETAEPLSLRGKSRPVGAYQLLAVDPSAQGRARRSDLPFVGRESELALVDWALARVLGIRSAHLLTVYGDAGIGKTRLVEEALARSPVQVLTGRCLPYGGGGSFAALGTALSSGAGVAVDDPPQHVRKKLAALAGHRADAETVDSVAALTGLLDAAPTLDPATALPGYLAAAAGDDGLVLFIDDLSNADEPFLDLLGDVIRRARGAPLMVVSCARPELLERRPNWPARALNAVAVLLEPLEADHTAILLDSRLGGQIEVGVRRHLIEVAAGNPLFLEELVAMLIERRVLATNEGGLWSLTDPTAASALPASVQALLAARVDTLSTAERALLGRAAVVGRDFPRDAVVALTPDGERGEVPAALDDLVGRELLRAFDHGRYGFRHQFVRDTVYTGLPRRVRAALHEAHAQWLDRDAPSPRLDELVAFHLEQALDERAALDADAVELEALNARVGERLATAGERALGRGDMPAADRLLGRALARLPEAHPQRPRLHADRGVALGERGDFAAAEAELAKAIASGEAIGDVGLSTHARLTAVWVRGNVDLTGWVGEAEALASEACAVFTQLGDERGLARAQGLLSEVHYLRGEYGAAEAALRRAEGHAAAAGDAVEERESALGVIVVLPPGPRPVPEGEEAVRALLERYPDLRAVQAQCHRVLALLLAMRGDRDGAAAAVAVARQRFEELGRSYWLAPTALTEGWVALLADDREEAEEALHRAREAYREIGDRSGAGAGAALLAETLPGDRGDEIADLVAQARDMVAPEDVEGQVRLRLAEARWAGIRGHASDAVDAARVAVETAEATDSLVLQAQSHLGLARALHLAGRAGEASREALVARERYARKGHTVGERMADAWLDAAATTPAQPLR
jgi:class 3 adenylate cyclase/tetratricopeptide (TPR) repeat protein